MKLPPGKAKAAALDVFNAHLAGAKLATKIKAKVEISEENEHRTASVSYSAEIPTTLIRLAGIGNVPIAGEAAAASPLPIHIDFHLLLDNTPSMGVGATTADIDTMVANTPDKCAFACHDLSAGGKDYYALAKKLGVTMRIDVVRAATQKLMDTAAAMAVVPGQYRAAVHTFGASCTSLGLTEISSLGAALSSDKAKAAAIDLMTIPYQNYNSDQCTDFDGVLAAMDKTVAAAGSGFSAASPQKVVFFVSDGVADAHYPSTCTQPTTGGRCQEALKTAACKALKDRGVRVAVLYTTYLPLPTNAWYNKWIAPFAGDIAKQMESCASPGLYFEVSPSEGIPEAMTALFKKAVMQAQIKR
jgi:hypothetical protein